ncbi:hypothetical protein F4778DRAFT_617489 [Xylariomycetidae sp. FL2044]|nr:hypothetical protein F4778DRAFT_617489 [Xylariomycetidae sp. FL2044]
MDELDEITKSFDDELRTKALTVVREQLSQCVQSSEKNRAELISRLAEFVDTEVASFHTKEDKLIKWFETRYSDHIHLVRQEADKQLEALKTVCHVNATLTAEDKAENRVTVTAEPARPVDNSSGAEPVPNLGNGTSKKRSRDRKRNKHGAAPKRVRGLTDDELTSSWQQREVFLEALKTRAPFQAAEMYGKAYAFELPKGSRQICVIYCAECEYFFDRSFEKYSNLVSNHWLLTNVHRHVWQRLRVCPLMMEDILERHTYRAGVRSRGSWGA